MSHQVRQARATQTLTEHGPVLPDRTRAILEMAAARTPRRIIAQHFGLTLERVRDLELHAADRATGRKRP